MRINHASDDSVGLAISESLHADSRIYTQAVRNVSDGLSAMAVAQGALEQMTNITTRQMELAEQSANGTYTVSQRKALDAEARALTNEFNRIAATTKFNGIQLFEIDGAGVRVQAGYGEVGSIYIELGAMLSRTVGDGTFGEVTTWDSIREGVAGLYDCEVADMNGDGKSDLISTGAWGNQIGVRLGNGDGSFRTSLTFQSPLLGMTVADIDNNGVLDVLGGANNSIVILFGNGDGTLQAAKSQSLPVGYPSLVRVGDFNSDGKLDFGGLGDSNQGLSIYLGNGNGSFALSFTTSIDPNTTSWAAGDYDADGSLDLMTQAHVPTASYTLFRGVGNGTFTLQASRYLNCWSGDMESADFNQDGFDDFIIAGGGGGYYHQVLLSNGDGSFAIKGGGIIGETWHASSVSDLNGDGYMDYVPSSVTTVMTYLGRGDGTFTTGQSRSIANLGAGAFGADLTGDGALELIVESRNSGVISVYSPDTQRIPFQAAFTIASRSSALAALEMLRQTKERIALEVGDLGSYQSRFGVALNTLAINRENYQASASRITDADIAAETSLLASRAIVQQAGAAVLSQANVQPHLALQLLSRT